MQTNSPPVVVFNASGIHSFVHSNIKTRNGIVHRNNSLTSKQTDLAPPTSSLSHQQNNQGQLQMQIHSQQQQKQLSPDIKRAPGLDILSLAQSNFNHRKAHRQYIIKVRDTQGITQFSGGVPMATQSLSPQKTRQPNEQIQEVNFTSEVQLSDPKQFVGFQVRSWKSNPQTKQIVQKQGIINHNPVEQVKQLPFEEQQLSQPQLQQSYWNQLNIISNNSTTLPKQQNNGNGRPLVQSESVQIKPQSPTPLIQQQQPQQQQQVDFRSYSKDNTQLQQQQYPQRMRNIKSSMQEPTPKHLQLISESIRSLSIVAEPKGKKQQITPSPSTSLSIAQNTTCTDSSKYPKDEMSPLLVKKSDSMTSESRMQQQTIGREERTPLSNMCPSPPTSPIVMSSELFKQLKQSPSKKQSSLNLIPVTNNNHSSTKRLSQNAQSNIGFRGEKSPSVKVVKLEKQYTLTTKRRKAQKKIQNRDESEERTCTINQDQQRQQRFQKFLLSDELEKQQFMSQIDGDLFMNDDCGVAKEDEEEKEAEQVEFPFHQIDYSPDLRGNSMSCASPQRSLMEDETNIEKEGGGFRASDLNCLNLTAKSVCIFDAVKNKVIIGLKAKKSREIASLTKIMTCYIICSAITKKKLGLNDVIKVSRPAASMIGTSACLRGGDQLKIIDLLFGMMLPSGNDAAFALAEHFGRILYFEDEDHSELLKINPNNFDNCKTREAIKAFISEMNRVSKQLKLTSTHYTNPHGLMHKGNRSSAFDVSKLACLFMAKSSLFRSIIKTTEYWCDVKAKSGQVRTMYWENTNKCLWKYPSICDGVKTGVTCSAGPCLTTSWRVEDKHFIITILKCDSLELRYAESHRIFVWLAQKLQLSISAQDSLPYEKPVKLKNHSSSVVSLANSIVPPNSDTEAHTKQFFPASIDSIQGSTVSTNLPNMSSLSPQN